MNRVRWLAATAVLAMLLAGCGGGISPAGLPPACNRACLENIADQFLDAMLRHDSSRLPLAPAFRYTENGQPLAAGDGSWKTLQSIGPFKQYVSDTDTGNVALLTTQEDPDGKGVLVLRLQIGQGAIEEAELLRTPAAAGHSAYSSLFRQSSTAVRRNTATTREQLVGIANQYFSAVENNDGKGDYSFLEDQCQRRENGVAVTGNQDRRQWPFTHPEFFTLGCRAQLETGVLGLVTRIRDRRYEVVDTERGQVLSLAVFDHDATQQSLELTDGSRFAAPPFYRIPRSLLVATLLQVGEDDIADIQTVQREVPYGLRPGFRATFEPSSAVPGGRQPAADASCDRGCISRGLMQLLGALQAGHPERAPLAGLLRYTENNQHLAVGDGLWATLTKVSGQPVMAIDGDQGWLLVGIERNGVAGQLGLRARFNGDRIVEIEAQVSATAQGLSPGLWPPAAADVQAVGSVTAEADNTALSRSALAGAAESWFAAALPALQQQGGRVRDRRIVLLDTERGLVVSRLFLDLPRGTATSPGAVTVLVELALTVREGRVHGIAGTEALLPYGSLPAWTAAR